MERYSIVYKNASEMTDATEMPGVRESLRSKKHFTLQIDENAGLRISF